MGGGCRAFVDQQFLVEFFAGPQPRIDNGDVAVGISAVLNGETDMFDHGPGERVDLDRSPHIQHEHIAAVGHGAGLDDQFGRLGNRHEIADDFGVGDGDRPTLLDLLAEQPHNGSRTVQHIAEAHHGENGLAIALARHRLQLQLGQPLACAHDVGGTHRLVG